MCKGITLLEEEREKADYHWTVAVRMLQLPSLEDLYIHTAAGGGEEKHMHCSMYTHASCHCVIKQTH